ncbi:hypothetical protein LLS1_25020 [Leifsonia sp. LS1]|uniref:hypothetical protein n=1 Tax=Leifsonia sp. LS1 TaxID=2828483 RepID=UPI001CFD4CDE|nr:hypothetical protein [Leifsonia sp. LS1]GIT80833.1 hypothetical protein LLS1_25020 [Leifsonia sp. LS1]
MTSRDTDAEPFGAPTHPDTTVVETPVDRSPPGGVLSAHYRWVSIGMCLLIMLAAFEALAVTTIMPTVSRELDGASLYAFAFAGPLAVSVVGMVLAGAWSDRATRARRCSHPSCSSPSACSWPGRRRRCRSSSPAA